MTDPKLTYDPAVEAAWAELAGKVKNGEHPYDLTKLREAVEFAAAAHEGQTRTSGEPYIVHPIAVANIVATLNMDEDSVIAAVLHDVLEDTETTVETITAKFGPDVSRMVQGVTKLALSVSSDASARQKAAAESARMAESLRKMLLAMAQDMRVMVIKLADRLHNMRTIGYLSPEKSARIANETLEIYAPLAARLGIWQIKWQLEDLAFKVLHPEEFKRISELISGTRIAREEEIADAIETLNKRLTDEHLVHFEISGRPKHLYSIFNKIVKQRIPFEEVYDLVAIRVIVEDQVDCYKVLGIVHDLWIPIQGQFSDYIGTPKPNGYQSLHTKVMGPQNQPLEVQIRTREMHDIAEHGVAAHWSYKEGKTKNLAETQFTTLRKQLFDWSTDHRESSDFLRSVSTDLFSEQVFAFTPKGDVIDLPAGSTPVDFAFRVHSELGHHLVGAKINGSIVPLSAEIKNGDVVELDTRKNAHPTLGWLQFVKSPHTKNKLRAYFRKQNRDQRIAQGKEALDREVKAMGLDPRLYLNDEMMAQVVSKLKDCDNPQDVFARVGEGLLSVKSVADKIRLSLPEQPQDPAAKAKPRLPQTTLITTGVDNVMVKRARCCQPLPGEEVVGYVTRGRGVVLHQRVCQNVLQLMETEPDRIQPVRWDPDGKTYEVTLKVLSTNRQGLLADMSNCFSESKTNVVSGSIHTTKHNIADNDFTIEVRDISHLRDVMARLGKFSDIMHVLRVQPRGGR